MFLRFVSEHGFILILQSAVYKAMYDYEAADEDEVSFKDGDTIVDIEIIDDGWMYGTVRRTKKRGMLPANYVERVQWSLLFRQRITCA